MSIFSFLERPLVQSPLHILDEGMDLLIYCMKDRQGNLELPAASEKRPRAEIEKIFMI